MNHRKSYMYVASEVGRLVTKKQEAYGDAFGRSGDVIRILYPNGVNPEQYDDFLAVTRVVDKLFRVATRKDAFGENPWKDIAGYGILASTRDRDDEPGEIFFLKPGEKPPYE